MSLLRRSIQFRFLPATSARTSSSSSNTPSVIAQQFLCAASSSSANANDKTDDGGASSSSSSLFLSYHNEFVLANVDYCAKLAEEANAKHGVPLQIPPQANPPSDRHRVVYCEVLSQRALDPSAFTYPPTHGPPPKEVPGMEATLLPSGAAGSSMIKTTLLGGGAGVGGKSTLQDLFPNPLKEVMELDLSLTLDDDGGEGPSAPSSSSLASGSAAAAAASSSLLTLSTSSNMIPKVNFPLPTDDEIDTLLLTTWDNAAVKSGLFSTDDDNDDTTTGDDKSKKKKYVPCSKFVVTVPPVEGLGFSPSLTLVASSDYMGESLSIVAPPKTETSVHFRTPFTLAVQQQQQFLKQQQQQQQQQQQRDVDDADDLSSSSSSLLNFKKIPKPPPPSKHLQKRFACKEPGCSRSFRIMDAVINHYKKDHGGKDVPVEVLLQYKALDNPALAPELEDFVRRQSAAKKERLLQLEKESNVLKKKQQEQQERIQGEEEVDRSNTETQKKAASLLEERDASSALASASASSTLTGEAAIRATPVPQVHNVRVHSRSASNATIVGLVRELRSGYVKTEFVVQMLVETIFVAPPAAAAASENNNNNNNNNNDDDASSAVETELHTVRCFGDDYARTVYASVTEGSRVVVQGTLKMNRHVDAQSGGVFASPFVKVVAPYGHVSVLPPCV